MLLFILPYVIDVFTAAINRFFEESTLPKNWKQAKVIAVPKKLEYANNVFDRIVYNITIWTTPSKKCITKIQTTLSTSLPRL
uniref:Uncharacterized protein n=1 Tax=Megaselia scalaris TaxID=36166 RepID=T1GIX5_MEGSC